MITIINYGLGNIKAFINVFNHLNIAVKTATIKEDLKDSMKLILPGVGAFDYAMSQLNASGMRDELEKQVLERNIPVLGICVGMQILAESSEEGLLSGLGWVPGKVKKFNFEFEMEKNKRERSHLALPHMGWNSIKVKTKDKIFKDLEPDSRFYFLHSYYFDCADKENSAATAFYGYDFTCAVRKDNIFGVQFHPEKSHHNGIKVLKNFAEM